MKRDTEIYDEILRRAGVEVVIDREALKEAQEKLKKHLAELMTKKPFKPNRAQRRRAKRERRK